MKAVSHRRSWFAFGLILSVVLVGGWHSTALGAPPDIDQMENGAATSPHSPTWNNGNANSSKAHFVEGYSQAYRLVMTDLPIGPHNVKLEWDTTSGGKHAIDFLTHYQRLLPHTAIFGHAAETINPLLGLASSFNAPTTSPIPAPSNATAAGAFNALPANERLMTIYNGSIQGMSYVYEEPLTNSNALSQLQINFTAACPGSNPSCTTTTVVFAWGGHLARSTDWGLGQSAGNIQGASYHMRFAGLDGSGGALQSKQLDTSAVVALNCGETLAGQCTTNDACGVAFCNPDTLVCTIGSAEEGTQCGGADPSNACEDAPRCDGVSPYCPANGNPLPQGTPCGISGNACEENPVCDGTHIYCPAAGAEKPNGTACDDGLFCTVGDVCTNGVCVGGSQRDCSAEGDQCNTGACQEQTASCVQVPRQNGTICSDGNACTQTDTCQAGVCTGSNPVTCTASDQCHVAGTCDPGTGVCSNPIKSNGSACNDGNACTQTDTCQAGVCTGNNPVTCTAQDQCHVAGTCNPANGQCSNPAKANNTPCNDGNACTQIDSCQNGSCVGSNPIICTALDVCHLAGTCDPTNGQCSNPTAEYGTYCDSQAHARCVESGGMCDGIGYCMPIVYSTAMCRPAAGICDVAEYCTGSSPNCPADLVDTRPNVECRRSAGTCDPAEYCDGVHPTCPADDVFDSTLDLSCKIEFCQTAGFWSTHAGTDKKNKKAQNITQAVMNLAAGGTLNICGEHIINTQLNDAASALEAMCVSPQGSQQLQLVRQLTATSLNCILSSGNANCDGVSINEVFDACNLACPSSTTITLGINTFSCIAALDCWNNGGIFHQDTGLCQTGTCSLDGVTACNGSSGCPLYYGQEQTCVPLVDSCHDHVLVKDGAYNFDPPGPAGSVDACNAAIGNKCTVVGAGEVLCGADSAP